MPRSSSDGEGGDATRRICETSGRLSSRLIRSKHGFPAVNGKREDGMVFQSMPTSMDIGNLDLGDPLVSDYGGIAATKDDAHRISPSS
jgi:hypothetical protein